MHIGSTLALLTIALPGIVHASAQTRLRKSSSSTSMAMSLPDAPSTLFAGVSVASSSNQATNQAPTAAPQAAPPPQNETEEARRERLRKESETQVKAQEKQRIGGVVPDFNVVLGGYAPPITAGQKWDLVFHSSTDPFTFATAFVLAGYDEISGEHNGYGWGPGGYFKRVGARYADTVDGAIIGNAVLPILLHQDPRYFRKGTGTIKSRIIYSALTTVICHGDNGKRQFNVSNVAGNFISGAISNAYYPASERGIGLTIENGATVTAEGTIAAQVLEFSPDVISAIKRHHQAAKDRKAAAAAAHTP